MRLLIYEPSFRRLEAEIAALGPAVEPLLMSRAGDVTLNGAPVAADAVNADAAWTNADVFFGPVARAFMVSMLKSPDLKEKLQGHGMEPTGLGPEELARIHRRDHDQWGPVIKASGFKPTN